MGVRTSLGAAVVLLVFGLTVAMAHHGPGSNARVSYVTATGVGVPGEPLRLDANCPGGQEIAGGGFDASVRGRVNDSMPIDGPDRDNTRDDAWRASFHFPPGDYTPRPKTYAICDHRNHKRGWGTTVLQPGMTSHIGSGRRGCEPIGGGVRLSGDPTQAFINFSRPWDNADRDSTPNDAWLARAHNSGETEVRMRVWSISSCGDRPLRHRTGRVARVAEGEAESAFAGCGPGEHLLGMGMRISGTGSHAWVRRIAPDDGPDERHVPDDGAAVAAKNHVGDRKALKPFAVCWPG